MKKNKDKKPMVTIPESGLLALVAAKLSDVALFPEKLEAAKEYLSKAKLKEA